MQPEYVNLPPLTETKIHTKVINACEVPVNYLGRIETRKSFYIEEALVSANIGISYTFAVNTTAKKCQKWKIKLSDYRYKIEYKRNTKDSNADTLSHNSVDISAVRCRKSNVDQQSRKMLTIIYRSATKTCESKTRGASRASFEKTKKIEEVPPARSRTQRRATETSPQETR